jgi:hypothetical protein
LIEKGIDKMSPDPRFVGREKEPRRTVLAEIWQGTLRLSKELMEVDGSILLHSTDGLPINIRRMNVALLFIIDPDDQLVFKIMDRSLMKLPWTIISLEEMESLSRIQPDRVLGLTNDYIVLSGNPPASINNMEIKNTLRKKMIDYLSDSFVKVRTLHERESESSIRERLRGAITLTMKTAKDLHRLKGINVHTVKPHLNRLFDDFPPSKSIVLDANLLIHSSEEVDLAHGWEMLSKFGNFIFLPILETVKDYSPLPPSLPPAPEDVKKEDLEYSFFNSILNQNLKIRSCLKNNTDSKGKHKDLTDEVTIEFDEDKKGKGVC